MRRLALVVVVAACGSDSGGDSGGGGPSTVDGTIGGRTITVADAISWNTDYPVGNGGTVLHFGTVVMGEATGLCDLATTQTAPAAETATLGLRVTTLDVSPSGNTSRLPTVGTYVINAGRDNIALATLHVDSMCSTFDATAVSGTVTLTSAYPSTGRYAGTFDLMFEPADHITGTFDPTVCTAITGPELACR